MAAKLFDAVATATGEWINMTAFKQRTFLTVQITSADAASSTIIQGRINSDHSAVDIVTITGSGADTCAYFNEMRVDVTTTAQLYADATGQ